jgi:hypothetical protein
MFFGVYYGTGQKLSETGRYLNVREYGKAMESATPSFISYPLQALREFNEGVSHSSGKPVYDYETKKQYQPSVWETLQRSGGLNPSHRSELSALDTYYYNTRKYWESKKRSIYEQYSVAKSTADKIKVHEKISEFNRNLSSNNLTDVVSKITPDSLSKSYKDRITENKNSLAFINQYK